MKKLHLGCGERYFEGYINIDFPSSEHTVQTKQVADVTCDITKLKFENAEIDEIRLHHVFEHFTRPVACALLSSWASWLKPEGILHIEVPDFDATCRNMLKNKIPSRMVGMRHLFGSEEAYWAIHYSSYGKIEFIKMMKCIGFKIVKTKKTRWKDTFNIVIIAKKDSNLSTEEIRDNFKQFLKLYCVDESSGELKMLDVWMQTYDSQIENQQERIDI